MGRGGFEPPKQVAADLQSVPFGHSGICPLLQNYGLRKRVMGIEPETQGFSVLCSTN